MPRRRTKRLGATAVSAGALALALPLSAIALHRDDGAGLGALWFGLPLLVAALVSLWSWSHC